MQNNWKQLLIASTCFFIITQNSLSEAAEQQWLSASGKCRLQFVSTNYTCTSVVYGFGSGRTLFSVLADPGTSLQISFSGGVDRNVPPDIYELVVDRLVMSSTSSPKKNGLPIPNYIPVSGSCRANMPKAKPLSSVECWVSDKTGKQVTLTFIADNSPVASMSFDAKKWSVMPPKEALVMQSFCKQGTCNHVAMRNVSTVATLKAGTLLEYETSSISKKCGDDDLSSDPCFQKSDLSEYRKFEKEYAFCSTRAPMQAFEIEQVFRVNYLNPLGTIYGYQAYSLSSYLTACHNWSPKSVWGPDYDSQIRAIGYLGVFASTQQDSRFKSAAEFVAWVMRMDSGLAADDYIGKWYADVEYNSSACKKPDGPEGPTTYTKTDVIGGESACKIVKSRRIGNATELSLSCWGEGEKYREIEIVEVVNGQLHSTVRRNGQKITVTYSRCP